MRWIVVPLALALVGGCDSIASFGSNCSAEKTAVRLSEGPPDDTTDAREVAGDFSERWTYQDDGGTRIYTFHWGASFDGCRVDGPISRSIIPLTF